MFVWCLIILSSPLMHVDPLLSHRIFHSFVQCKWKKELQVWFNLKLFRFYSHVTCLLSILHTANKRPTHLGQKGEWVGAKNSLANCHRCPAVNRSTPVIIHAPVAKHCSEIRKHYLYRIMCCIKHEMRLTPHRREWRAKWDHQCVESTRHTKKNEMNCVCAVRCLMLDMFVRNGKSQNARTVCYRWTEHFTVPNGTAERL